MADQQQQQPETVDYTSVEMSIGDLEGSMQAPAVPVAESSALATGSSLLANKVSSLLSLPHLPLASMFFAPSFDCFAVPCDLRCFLHCLCCALV
eukprot:m.230221 g.230221  ORF g.230221 m.230221 type:complete len:94 (-) comp54267_c0_seq8:784-1065(-)